MRKGILTDLDTLLDTKFIIALLIGGSTTGEFISSGKYYTRFKDNFGLLSYDIFNAFYETRTKNILTYSIFTNIVNVIAQTSIDMKKDLTKSDGIDIVLYINTYPYNLSNDELDIFKKAINNLLTIEVEFINKSTSDLSVSWIKDNVEIMFLVDGLKWIEYKIATLELINTPLLNKTLVVPMLVNGTIKSKDINGNLIDNMANFSSTVINLEQIEVKYFCPSKSAVNKFKKR